MTNVLRAVDFSAIEARVTAWLAGEEKTLDAFRAYDAGTGPDLYKVAASLIYNVPVEDVTDAQRQVGKCAILACGFGGGVGAFAKMAKTYGLDIGEAFDPVWSAATPTNKEKVSKAWEDRGKQSGMAKKKWFAAEAIKLAWRDNSPKTVDLWKAIEDAAIEAALHPGQLIRAGAYLKYRRSGSWLFCQLPSKRVITYPYPRVEWVKTPWGSERPKLIYKGVDSFSKKWCDQDFYGGLGTENAVQGTARDIMRDAMFRVEKAGYRIVLTVHDEILAENRADEGSFEELCLLTATRPTWAPDLPIAVEGWEGPRYRK